MACAAYLSHILDVLGSLPNIQGIMARKKKNNGLPYVGKYQGKPALYWYDETGTQRRKLCQSETIAETLRAQKEKDVRGNTAFVDTGLRAAHTSLTDQKLRDAETAFAMLESRGIETTLADVAAFYLDEQEAKQESPLLEAFIESHIEGKEKRAKRSLATIKQLKTNLGEFNAYCRSNNILHVHEVTRETIETYLDTLKVRPNYGPRFDKEGKPRLIAAGATTKANRLTTIGAIFNSAVNRQILKYNPCAGIDKADSERKPKAFFSIDQVIKLLEKAKEEDCFAHYYFRLATMFRELETNRFAALENPWDFINLETGKIHLPGSCCKTRADKKRGGRYIDINLQPNLKAFLTVFKEKKMSLSKSRRKERRIFNSLNANVEERHNILRDTAISLHAKYIESALETSEEAGNTERMVKTFYLVKFTKEEASRFFDLKPADFGL